MLLAEVSWPERTSQQGVSLFHGRKCPIGLPSRPTVEGTTDKKNENPHLRRIRATLRRTLTHVLRQPKPPGILLYLV